MTSAQVLSPTATALLDQLRRWASSLPPESATVREDSESGYGGLLFQVRPSRPGAMDLAVGLGSSSDVDFFWGGRYGWENWTSDAEDVLALCEAIKAGDVAEETWRLGGVVVEKRCYIRPDGHRVGDGSPVLPSWLKRWARVSVRRYAPWI
jgi:hypothetical protein